MAYVFSCLYSNYYQKWTCYGPTPGWENGVLGGGGLTCWLHVNMVASRFGISWYHRPWHYDLNHFFSYSYLLSSLYMFVLILKFSLWSYGPLDGNRLHLSLYDIRHHIRTALQLAHSSTEFIKYFGASCWVHGRIYSTDFTSGWPTFIYFQTPFICSFINMFWASSYWIGV